MPTQIKRPQKYRSLRVKSLVWFSIGFIAIFAAGVVWVYNYSTQQAIDEIHSKLLVTGEILASQIDVEEHQGLYENPDYNPDEGWPMGMHDQRYWKIADLLYDVHVILPQAYLYTYVPAGEDSVEIVVSHGAVLDPVEGAYFRELYVPGPDSSMLQGLKEVTLSRTIVDDPWGSWMSVFIPLTDDEGKIVASLGIDYKASEIPDLQTKIFRNVIPVFLGIYSIFFALTLFISNQLISPIASLTRAASRLGQGDFSEGFESIQNKKVTDEADLLADTLTLMVDNILARDKQIRAVLAEQQDFIIRLDPEYHFTFANSVYCEAFGQDESTLVGTVLDLNIFEPDRPLLEEFLRDVLPHATQQNPQFTLEIRMRLQNGETRWIQWSVRALFEKNGSVYEYQAVGRDISALKALQHELEVTNNKLRQLSHQLLDDRESEAKKLAQMLHDHVLSKFTAFITAQSNWTEDETINTFYHDVIAMLRQTIYELRSPMLAYGLYFALDDFQEEFGDKLNNGQALIFEIEQSDVRYDEVVETQIFRMVQEACENVRTHSEADIIRISGCLTEDNLEITIEDNGIGFNADDSLSDNYGVFVLNKHFGLAGMQERAELIGAVLKIESGIKKGTKVRIIYQPEES